VEKTLEKPSKPLGFSKTVATRYLAPEATATRRAKPGRAAQPGRPSSRLLKRIDAGAHEMPEEVAPRGSSQRAAAPPIASLVREWLAELKVMGRSEQTIKWYRQKMEFYLEREGGPATLDGLTSGEVKRLLGNLIDRRLAPNTIQASLKSYAPSLTGRCAKAFQSTRRWSGCGRPRCRKPSSRPTT
jgi:hypothetical protein